MAYEVTDEINDFYSRYPNAAPIFVNEDDKTYLNHFEDKALEEAKRSEKTLYKVDKELVVTQVYPVPLPATDYTYTLDWNNPGGNYQARMICNETMTAFDDVLEASVFQAVVEGVIETAGLSYESVGVEQADDVFLIVVVSKDDFVLQLEDNDGTGVTNLYTFSKT